MILPATRKQMMPVRTLGEGRVLYSEDEFEQIWTCPCVGSLNRGRRHSLVNGKYYVESSAFWTQQVIPQAMGNKGGPLHFVMSMQAADWNRVYSFLKYNLLALKLELKIIDFILKLDMSHFSFSCKNAVSTQPCVGKLGLSLVLLNFLDCKFRLWFETP